MTAIVMTLGHLFGFWVFRSEGEDQLKPLFRQPLHAKRLQAALVLARRHVPLLMLLHSGRCVDCDWMGFEVGHFCWGVGC